MKQIWPDYSYSPTTNVLTLTGLNIDRDQLLLVSAPERGRIMYNFADSAVTASAFTAGANTALTLVATTAGLTTTASLIIYYDDQLQSTSVTVANFPATQTVAGTVTANAVLISPSYEQINAGIESYIGDYGALPISGTVTIGNTVAIAGTVTANPTGTQTIAGTVTVGQIQGYKHASTATDGPFNADVMLVGEDIEASYAAGLVVIPAARGGGVLGGRTAQGDTPICVYGDNGNAVTISGTVTIGNTVAIAGTVTANPTGTQTIAGTVTANGLAVGSTVANVFPIGVDTLYSGVRTVTDLTGYRLPISLGDSNAVVSASLSDPLPAGTNRIGVVTIGGGTVTIGAGTAQIGSVTASISGTVPVSISSVTVGNSVTIASLPAISGTVTANLAISATPITKGSFTSLTSATLVPANTSRKMATVYNLGAGQLFVNAGATATTLGGGFMVALSSGDFYECDYTTTTLSAIFATAGTASWISH